MSPSESLRLDDYAYDLPRERIAQHPVTPRDASRLLVLDRQSGEIQDRCFHEIGQFLRKGDLLVLNDTRVMPARLVGQRSTTGRVEILFLRDLGQGKWEALIKCNGNPRAGESIAFEAARLRVRLIRKTSFGGWEVSLPKGANLPNVLEDVGRMPLPPYIARDDSRQFDSEDRERYQTVYARHSGAAAAPTAGLHFTPQLLGGLTEQGVRIAHLTLHVGLGTFRPIKSERITDHEMHAEFYTISEETAQAVRDTRRRGGRIVGVGTTVCRALESAAAEKGEVQAAGGWTSLFIHPPHEFRTIDLLVTNFHLPRSTLLVLVSAFAGRELILRAYEHAKEAGYRFYSYGDAMLII